MAGTPLYKYLLGTLSWIRRYCPLLLMLLLNHLQIGLLQYDLHGAALEKHLEDAIGLESSDMGSDGLITVC